VTDPKVVAGLMLRGARWFVVWLLSLQLLAVVVAAVINGLVNDPITQSVWQWPALFWIRFPLVGVGAGAASGSLAVFVANGVTRRTYVAGVGLFGLAVCAITAGVSVLAYFVERAVYAIGGFDTNLVDQQPLHFGTVYLLLLACYLVSGVLIGAGFARLSALVAACLVVLFISPFLVGELLLGTWWGGIEKGQLHDVVPLAAGAPIVVAVVCAAAIAAWLLLRDLAIRPKKG
jgi:hypothetical protein